MAETNLNFSLTEGVGSVSILEGSMNDKTNGNGKLEGILSMFYTKMEQLNEATRIEITENNKNIEEEIE